MARKRKAIEVGSGDVFVDLGLADAGERKLRVQLAMQVNELIAQRRLTQSKAAALLHIPQPHVSELKHYKLSRFSSERLLRFRVSEGFWIEDAIPLRWSQPEQAPQLAATGSWQDTDRSIAVSVRRNAYRPFVISRIDSTFRLAIMWAAIS